MEVGQVASWNDPGWALFMAEAPAGAPIRLSAEHDRFLWASLAEALARCRPETVVRQVEVVARELEHRRPKDRHGGETGVNAS
ncbi:hypothetical protein Tmar_0808 [Thermaerobacter marianensis DSM 12885]|uniref:NUDIX hydrolase n=1 Tax=Thermaerobacter marianensis (strain ATCC 700841 / DSM 12885 / JCM 10246 / 7p75a) TaxID=644966 RepID=E6SIL7_THEM7|nr:hypothetical protein [Thermaerobacter marianensis]ADU50923.1 hypothetical protein Tmar_0808 [Thermaerobacter marianensis DSM 12885]